MDAIPEPEDDAPSVAENLQQATRAEALQKALSQLPERQRQAVVLRHIEGLSNPEIAQIMDIGPRAVESLTARGKRALEALLLGRKDELGYEDDD
jgi:RNA polymerase sigma-70 factor (ECF subfamily)